MDYKTWLDDAKRIIETEIDTGKVFETKSIFPPYKWDTLSPGEKRAFGRFFPMK